MTKRSPIASEDVMNAFAMDFELGSGVLKQYLADYPQFSAGLVDLARELSRLVDEERELSAQELAAVDAKVSRLCAPTVTVEMLTSAPPKTFTDAAKVLGLPMQVGIAIRERRIDVATLSRRFLSRLANELKASVSVVEMFLLMPAQVSAGRANKSTGKPDSAEKVSLERLLKDAGMDEEGISRLLLGGE